MFIKLIIEAVRELTERKIMTDYNVGGNPDSKWLCSSKTDCGFKNKTPKPKDLSM